MSAVTTVTTSLGVRTAPGVVASVLPGAAIMVTGYDGCDR